MSPAVTPRRTGVRAARETRPAARESTAGRLGRSRPGGARRRSRCSVDMRHHLRSVAFAAALLVPAVTFAAAGGESPDARAGAHAAAGGHDASPGDRALQRALADAVT